MLATANFVEFLFHALACIEVCSVYYLALCDSPEPFIKAEFTSRTPETWRRPSTRESSSSSWLPLPRTSSASSSPAEEPGRTTMCSRGTSEASISLLKLPCLKIGYHWRIRRGVLEDFLKERERPRTLVGQLSSFLRVPDSVLGIAQNIDILHHLDAAFFRVGEERGGFWSSSTPARSTP